MRFHGHQPEVQGLKGQEKVHHLQLKQQQKKQH